MIKDSGTPASPSLDRKFRPYVFSLALVAIAASLRLVLPLRTPTPAPFLYFYPAVILATFFWGLGPGMFAVSISAVAAAALAQGRPGVFKWIVFFILGPVLVAGFSRLKRLRERSAVLSEESRKLRFVVDRASDWIFLVSDQGVIQYVNQAACSNLGYSSADLFRRRIQTLSPEADRGAFQDVLEKCQQNVIAPVECVFERKDHSRVTVEIGCTAIAAQHDRVIHVAVRDVTDRKSIEKKLRDARQWEGLGALAGGVAHDFNNLLTSIMGNASLARDILPPDHAVVGLLESIEAAGERSAELVRLMLATSGYKPRYIEAIRVDETLFRLLRERSLPNGVTTRISTEECSVESDRRSIETLLWSLISNAAESYESEAGEIEIEIRLNPPDSAHPGTNADADFEEGDTPVSASVHVVVEDHGSGMTADVLERAFDPFFSTRFTGRGLGLPAVRGIVRAHSGKLLIRTAEGSGTRVEVWIPCARVNM